MSRYISLVVLVLCVASSYAMKVVDIDTICKHEEVNTSLCITLLKSKQGADLLILAQYTIDVLYTEVNNTVTLINTLIHQYYKDLEAKSHYIKCVNLFGEPNGAAGDIKRIESTMKDGDYGGMNEKVLSILIDYDSCINGEYPTDTPYPDKSLLPKYAKVVHDVAFILFVISDYLIGNV
ncbi:pectinesterase inhibitor 1-like [Cicer arietinum]|uniref:pectinesterase inhibitor 1-like n=1 Tax=Cicer arietinum TaxID=3827 RepID=UPI00032A6E93